MRLGLHAVGRLAVVASVFLLLGAARFDRYADYLDSGNESRPHPHPLDEPACRDCPGADASAEGAKLLDRPGAPFGSDCAAAVPLFLDAAAKGNVAAARALGFCYWYGNGVTHVRAEAIKWYRIPATVGEAESSFRLGNLLFEEAGSAYPDPTLRSEANAWWQKAAQAGHPRALYTLAKLNPDPAQRFALMQRAADAGLPDAEYAVARAYIEGAGVAKDEAKGRRLLERLDAEGRRIGDYFARADASAYIPCTLAQPWTPPARLPLTKADEERLAHEDCDALHYGLGVARDDEAAFACYQPQGDTVQLAIMYANGYGTARDLDAALHFACLDRSSAPAEHEALVGRIAAARKGQAVEPFDFCDIATSGVSDAICADRASSLARQAQDDDLARIRTELSQFGRTTLARACRSQPIASLRSCRL